MINLQIKASDIDFWNKGLDYMSLRTRCEKKIYPPRIVLTVVLKSSDTIINLPIKFSGCVDEDDLDVELIFPIGNCMQLELARILLLLLYHVGFPPLSPTSSFSAGSQNATQLQTTISE